MQISEEDFLEHYGVKGMRWGVRRNKKLQSQASSTDKRTTQGKKVKSMASESQRVQNAGGGLKGTRRVRKEMIKSGELSKSDARKGDARFARNLAIATAGVGVTAYLVAKNGNKKANLASKEIAIDKHLHKAASLRKSLGKNKVPKAPKKAFKPDPDLAKMKARAAATVKEANAQLRARDNEFNIPIPERSYLKEWG